MREWKEVKLGELIEIVNGFAFKSKNFLTEKTENSLPVIKIKNVASGQVTLNDVQYHIYDIAHERFIVKRNDILIALTGNHPHALTQVVGEVSISKLDEKALLNQRVAKIKPKSKILNSFLYYFLKDDGTHEYLASQSAGSANQANISKKNIEGVPINLPSIPEQRAIASVLSGLDDKIDLLHRQNKTLEQMAETLFRQWFVEEAEESWEEGELADILTMKGGTTPSTKVEEFWNGDIHWTSPRDITQLKGIYLFDTERKITEAGLAKVSSGLLPKGTLLMSSRAPVGVLAFAEVELAINQGYIAIIDNMGFSKEFIYLWLKTNMDYVRSYANGSTFLEIPKSVFKTLKIMIPDSVYLAKYQELLIPYFSKIRSNQIQISSLEKLRDTLLPKLMSGEVSVGTQDVDKRPGGAAR